MDRKVKSRINFSSQSPVVSFRFVSFCHQGEKRNWFCLILIPRETSRQKKKSRRGIINEKNIDDYSDEEGAAEKSGSTHLIVNSSKRNKNGQSVSNRSCFAPLDSELSLCHRLSAMIYTHTQLGKKIILGVAQSTMRREN